MNFFPSAENVRAITAQSGIKNPQDWLMSAFSGVPYQPSLSGVTITEENQLIVNTHFDCLSLIAETMGSLRPNLYKERKGGGKDIATDEPLQLALRLKPNPEMDGRVRRETGTLNLGLYGDKYDYTPRDSSGQASELWPLHPSRVTKRRDLSSGNIVYDVVTNGQTDTLSFNEILHVPYLTSDGLCGRSNMSFQRTRLEIAAALDEFEARYFGSGMNSSIIAEYGGATGAEFIDREKQGEYLKSLQESFSGLKKSHGMMILEGGMKARELNTRLDWAMLDQRQRDAATKICGMWRVPPPLIGILDKATFNNISHLDLQFGKYCIRIWAHREEDAMNSFLLTDAQRRAGYMIEYSLDDIYRTDIETLSNALQVAWDRGVINSDEWRDKIGRNPKPDGTGKKFYVNQSWMPEENMVLESENNEKKNVIPIRETGGKVNNA